MLESNDFGQYVVARLLDFFRPGDRWFRGLWDVGIVLSLHELLEGAEAAANGVLSDAAVAWLANDVRANVRRDPGVPKQLLHDLLECFKNTVQFRETAWHSLFDLSDEINR